MDDQVRMKHSSARNPAIELFRCVMMLGVVAIHVFGGMGARWWWLSYALLFCVDGFVFISGYYGIHFRVGKLFRLYCVIFYCSFISVAVQYLGGRTLTGGGGWGLLGGV